MRQIDLSGPDGNVFALIGIARNWAKQLDRDPSKIAAEMMSGDYDKAVEIFEREFCGPAGVCELINKP